MQHCCIASEKLFAFRVVLFCPDTSGRYSSFEQNVLLDSSQSLHEQHVLLDSSQSLPSTALGALVPRRKHVGLTLGQVQSPGRLSGFTFFRFGFVR